MNLWIILSSVLIILVIGGLLFWLFTARRPTKLDPLNELLIQDLVRLQHDNPERAADIIARALVRSGLVTRTDLERIGETPSHPSKATPRSESPRQQTRSDDQRTRSRNDNQQLSQRNDSRQQSGGRDQSTQRSQRRSRRPNRGGGQRNTAAQTEKRRDDSASQSSPPETSRETTNEKPTDGTEQKKPVRRRRPRRRSTGSSGAQNPQSKVTQSDASTGSSANNT